MRVLWRCVFVTDIAVLAALIKGIRFAADWLSLTQARIEQGLIAAYTVCAVGGAWPLSVRWTVIAVQLPIAAWMWWMHRRPSAARTVALFTLAGPRVFSLVVFSLISVPVAWARWPGWGFTLAMNVLYVAIYYLVSLPSGGEPGRRRKLALAKLKEMFGTSWVPVPAEGMPCR